MRLRFILSQTFRGLYANKAMALSVVLVTFVSLLFVGVGALAQTQVNNLRSQWYDNVEVSVYMCPVNSTNPRCASGEATDEQIDEIANFIDTDKDVAPLIESVQFESKDEALTNFRKMMADTAWVNAVTADQMQASFRIKLKDPEKYEIVTDALTGKDGVDEVDDQRDQLEPLFDVLNRMTILSGALAAVMIVTALLLMPTTIRLSAMSRKNETEIMRYVGASNFFIEFPFILEGVLSALLGSILASVGLWVSVRYFISDWFAQSLTWVRVVDVKDVFLIIPFLILGSVLVAGFASWVTLRRYARV